LLFVLFTHARVSATLGLSGHYAIQERQLFGWVRIKMMTDIINTIRQNPEAIWITLGFLIVYYMWR
ncbi:MAG: hypothetical protein EB127_23185, partial [Alphaproteobacteria bacterium]|nr:hypothetical protein [Alphaproteobacteria bacterium]